MSWAWSSIRWAALAVLLAAQPSCWPGLGNDDCVERIMEIAPGETHGDTDPWALAAWVEGTWTGTMQWVYVSAEPGISITLECGDGDAVALYVCNELESVVVPVTLWVRTDDGALDVVFDGQLELDASGVPTEDRFLIDLPPQVVPPVVLTGDATRTLAAGTVQLELELDKSGETFGYLGGDLTHSSGSYQLVFGEIQPLP